MVPNVCFPLFPVVDFQAFRRSHYAIDAHQTYQQGIDWIVRGVVHLILYRYIYYYVTLAPSEVSDPAQFMQYVVSNFLLYLRVPVFYMTGCCISRLPSAETHNGTFSRPALPTSAAHQHLQKDFAEDLLIFQWCSR
jgi:hypothetical protein